MKPAHAREELVLARYLNGDFAKPGDIVFHPKQVMESEPEKLLVLSVNAGILTLKSLAGSSNRAKGQFTAPSYLYVRW